MSSSRGADRAAPDLTWDELVGSMPAAADPVRYAAHYERVMDCDLDYPIHLVEYRGRLVVLDGNHRLLKASFLRRRWVEAHVLTEADLESIRRW